MYITNNRSNKGTQNVYVDVSVHNFMSDIFSYGNTQRVEGVTILRLYFIVIYLFISEIYGFKLLFKTEIVDTNNLKIHVAS